MARKSYNGYSVQDRHISFRLFKRDMTAGLFPNPKKGFCEACLLTEGQLDSHREDYSLCGPDGLVTLCYRCHRVLHMRDTNAVAWDAYRGAIRRGYQWSATRAFGKVMAENVNGRILPSKLPVNAPRERTILDDIHDGLLLADPPEVRQARMQALYDRYQKLEAEGRVRALELPIGA